MTIVANRRYLLLSFDYELFLGERSGTVINCLITPTNHLLEILSRHGAKAIFFIDTIYLHCLKEAGINHPRARQDYHLITAQLARIAENGHYLFHHIHPHWFDAVYLPEIDQWSSENYTHFALSGLTVERRHDLFLISHQMMQQICPGQASYDQGFRAGGLYVQPFSDLIEGFREFNIRYDFSVLPGFKSEEAYHGFDFSKSVQETPYRFSEDILQPDIDGEFCEFPISTMKASMFSKLINSLWYRLITKKFSQSKWGDGLGSKNKIFPVDKNDVSTIETISVELLNSYRSLLYQKYFNRHTYMHIISHPKLISGSQLNTLDGFLSVICRKYQMEFDFKKCIEEVSATNHA